MVEVQTVVSSVLESCWCERLRSGCPLVGHSVFGSGYQLSGYRERSVMAVLSVCIDHGHRDESGRCMLGDVSRLSTQQR